MTDRPIIFGGPMVRALLSGAKTQTRRLLKPQPKWGFTPWLDDSNGEWMQSGHGEAGDDLLRVPFRIGDQLWVREAHALLPRTAYRASIGTGSIAQREHPTDGYTAAVFREGFDRSGRPQWRPSIHMHRWASRLTLTVIDVRAQRLQDISEEDARAESVCAFVESTSRPVWGDINAEARAELVRAIYGSHQDAFQYLWQMLHGVEAWDADPWVVAISFVVERRNIDLLQEADTFSLPSHVGDA